MQLNELISNTTQTQKSLEEKLELADKQVVEAQSELAELRTKVQIKKRVHHFFSLISFLFFILIFLSITVSFSFFSLTSFSFLIFFFNFCPFYYEEKKTEKRKGRKNEK